MGCGGLESVLVDRSAGVCSVRPKRRKEGLWGDIQGGDKRRVRVRSAAGVWGGRGKGLQRRDDRGRELALASEGGPRAEGHHCRHGPQGKRDFLLWAEYWGEQ